MGDSFLVVRYGRVARYECFEVGRPFESLGAVLGVDSDIDRISD